MKLQSDGGGPTLNSIQASRKIQEPSDGWVAWKRENMSKVRKVGNVRDVKNQKMI